MILHMLLFIALSVLCLSLFVSAKTISLVKMDMLIVSAQKSGGETKSYVTFTSMSKLKLFFYFVARAYNLPELYLFDTEEVQEALRDAALKSLTAEAIIVYRGGDDGSVD